MGRSTFGRKTELLTARVTPEISEAVKRIATSEGLNIAEWLRKLIVLELRSNGMIR